MDLSLNYPREVATGGATGVAIWFAANAFKKIGPRIGFGSLGLGAAANAVSMAVGVPVLAGYAISYAIAGKSGVEDYEYFLTHPLDMPFNTAMSIAVIHHHYSSKTYDTGDYDPVDYEGLSPGVF